MNRKSFFALIFGGIGAVFGLPLGKVISSRSGWPAYPEKLVNGVWTVNGHDVSLWALACRKKLASLAPDVGYSSCNSCGLPWWCVQGHAIRYEDNRGCFAACEMCWKDFGSELLPLYEDWVKQYYPGDMAKLERVRRMEEM